MTRSEPESDQVGLSPARRARGRAEPVQPGFEDAEVARGQAAAVLGALGRMQLRLDALARRQEEALGRIEESLLRLEGQRPTDSTARDPVPGVGTGSDPQPWSG